MLSATLTSIAAVAAGGSHTLALRTDGTVLAAGLNGNGQLGDATLTQRSTPITVSGLGVGSTVAIAAGKTHSLAVKSDGTVVAWDLNTNCQLGDNSTVQKTAPVTVGGLLSGVTVTAVAGGNRTALP
jgi:alpha-tubulin suppressor-like RCC1 family protein